MKLIDDDSDDNEELPAPDKPPELEPPVASRANSTTRVETQRTAPPIIRWIVAAVIILILAFLILLLARWIYHRTHHKVQPVPATSQQSGQSSNLSAQSGQSQQSAGNTSNNSSGSSTGSGSLPNNGPGNVAGIFAVSTATAAGLHYVVRSRRFNNN